MGDGLDVVSQRMEDSPLREGVNLRSLGKESGKKIKDAGCLKDGKKLSTEAKDVPEKHPGEQGEPTEKTRGFETHDNNVSTLQTVVTEPEVLPFPYSDTKLRPEAPPFTPECVSPNPEPAYGEPETDSSCFVNVDLKLVNQEEEPFTEVGLEPVAKRQRDANELEDVGPKTFTLTSTVQLKKSVPDVEIPGAVEDDPIVAVRPATPSGVSETRESPGSERVNILSLAFFLGNKTQIIVLIASVVVCVILVIFVLV